MGCICQCGLFNKQPSIEVCHRGALSKGSCNFFQFSLSFCMRGRIPADTKKAKEVVTATHSDAIVLRAYEGGITPGRGSSSFLKRGITNVFTGTHPHTKHQLFPRTHPI